MQTRDDGSVTMSVDEFSARYNAAFEMEVKPAFVKLFAENFERLRGDEIADVRLSGSAFEPSLIVEWRSGAAFILPFSFVGDEH